MKKLLQFSIICMLASPVLAVEPDEILSDPILESRARELSKELRCLVCRNENIDSSNADIAKDLRLLVRERLLAGDTNDDALAFIVDRYGEYVLLKPPFNRANAILYLSGPLFLFAGGLFSILYIRRRKSVTEVNSVLTEEEQNRLQKLLDT